MDIARKALKSCKQIRTCKDIFGHLNSKHSQKQVFRHHPLSPGLEKWNRSIIKFCVSLLYNLCTKHQTKGLNQYKKEADNQNIKMLNENTEC
jgi:hypothetical protein